MILLLPHYLLMSGIRFFLIPILNYVRHIEKSKKLISKGTQKSMLANKQFIYNKLVNN
jgi:hypothetical protein